MLAAPGFNNGHEPTIWFVPVVFSPPFPAAPLHPFEFDLLAEVIGVEIVSGGDFYVIGNTRLAKISVKIRFGHLAARGMAISVLKRNGVARGRGC